MLMARSLIGLLSLPLRCRLYVRTSVWNLLFSSVLSPTYPLYLSIVDRARVRASTHKRTRCTRRSRAVECYLLYTIKVQMFLLKLFYHHIITEKSNHCDVSVSESLLEDAFSIRLTFTLIRSRQVRCPLSSHSLRHNYSLRLWYRAAAGVGGKLFASTAFWRRLHLFAVSFVSQTIEVNLGGSIGTMPPSYLPARNHISYCIVYCL